MSRPKPSAKPERSSRPTQQEQLAYGRHAVRDLMARGLVERLWLLETLKNDTAIGHFVREAGERRIPVEWVKEHYYESRIGQNPHQGVLAQVKPYAYAGLDEVLTRAQAAKEAGDFAGATILMLDGLEDPGNFGGILRTAAGLGIAGVIIPNRRSVGVTAAVYKTSAGTVGKIPLAQVANLRYALDALKEAGWWGVGATMGGALTPSGLPQDIPLVLLMGSEHEGLSRLLLEQCDYTVSIPMHNGVESLNVGAATAILLAGICLSGTGDVKG